MLNGLIEKVRLACTQQNSGSYAGLLGAWILHPVLILAGKIIVDTVPGMTQDISWTVVNLAYLLVTSPPPRMLG